jgi:hypothetical protein
MSAFRRPTSEPSNIASPPKGFSPKRFFYVALAGGSRARGVNADGKKGRNQQLHAINKEITLCLLQMPPVPIGKSQIEDLA